LGCTDVYSRLKIIIIIIIIIVFIKSPKQIVRYDTQKRRSDYLGVSILGDLIIIIIINKQKILTMIIIKIVNLEYTSAHPNDLCCEVSLQSD
jgi:hypothetical protein